jgi:WD40 repeat protein
VSISKSIGDPIRIDVDVSESNQIVRLSPGGTRMALSYGLGDGKEVLVVDVPSGREVARYSGLDGVWDVAFRSETHLLVIHGANCWLCDLARKTHTVIREEKVSESGPLYCLSQGPDGQALALGANRALLLWDTRRKRLLRALKAPAGGWAYGAAFSPDGRYVAGHCPPGGVDGLDRMMCFVGIWDVNSGDCVRIVKQDDESGRAAFRPDNRMLAISRKWGILLYDLSEPKPGRINLDEIFTPDLVYAMGWTEPAAHHRLEDSVTELAFSMDGKSLLVACAGGNMVRLNARTGRALNQTKAPAGHGRIHGTTTNGNGLAAGLLAENAILVWQVPRWRS